MKKIAIATFGCKINQYESSCIAEDFVKAGYNPVNFRDKADVYIINTCTVTGRTDFKSRNAVRKALKVKEKHPDVKVIVTGCYAQRSYDEILEIGDIDYIADNNSKNKIVNYIIEADEKLFGDILREKKFSEHSTGTMLEKSRAFVKVQDGCDYYCAYCAIPFARGHSRSRKSVDALNQIKLLVKNGYREVVLGGINLGLYQDPDNPEYRLIDLLKDINRIDGLEFVRLSSIEPQLFTEEFIKQLIRIEKVVPHFHIPLQNGTDEILTSMRRQYNTELFRSVINNLNSYYDNPAIGIDVIVGLPGETEELFNKAQDFLTELEFTYLHVFSYSIRKGTLAEKMKNHVSSDDKKHRSNILHHLSDKKTAAFVNKIIAEELRLSGVSESNDSGITTALSNRYVRIYKHTGDNESDIISGVTESVYREGVLIK